MAQEIGEYFIGVGKRKAHSFAFVGQVNKDGVPTLYAAAGKYAGLNGSACLVNELWIDGQCPRDIFYQAYSITGEQVQNYRKLMSQIVFNNFDKDNQYCCMDTPPTLDAFSEEIMQGYVRVKNAEEDALYYGDINEDFVQKLVLNKDQLSQYDENIISTKSWKRYTKTQQDFLLYTLNLDYARRRLYWLDEEIKQINSLSLSTDIQNIRKFNAVNNTCRTTAITITKEVLGFTPNVSKAWWVNPDYQTGVYQKKLGKLNSNFYIFPTIPTQCYDKNTPLKNMLLKKMFVRLTAISKTKQTAYKETYDKFVVLKALYNQIAAVKDDNAETMRSIIKSRNKNALKQKRAPNFFSRSLPDWDTSTTSKLLNSIEKQLAKACGD